MAADEGSQDTLRLQFKAMQELQHRRLQQQMEKKREKEKEKESRDDDPKGSMEISDGLSFLHTEEQNLKSIFEQRVLEDEIQQLRDELRETVDENGRLYKLLKERDFEIKHLKKKMEEDRFAFTGSAGVAGDVVATKIVELSKKNRALMAESEGGKMKMKQLTNRIQELEQELQTALSRLPAKGSTDAGAKPPRAQLGDKALPETPEVKVLKDRLATMNLKMSDLRNQVQSVKQELRMTQKVFQSLSSAWDLLRTGAGLGKNTAGTQLPSFWSRECPASEHPTHSGTGSRCGTFLPGFLPTVPSGGQGHQLPEGHSFVVPTQLWTKEDTSVHPEGLL